MSVLKALAIFYSFAFFSLKSKLKWEIFIYSLIRLIRNVLIFFKPYNLNKTFYILP
jgi:uncharacterized protein (DUF486 family)